MAKIKAGNIERGMYLLHNQTPHKVVKKKFVSPGKGSAFTRTKLENLETGSIISHVFKSHDRVEEIYVESREMQFLYQTGGSLVFMDPRTYEQVEVPAKVLGEKAQYLVPETKVYVASYQDKALAVSLPAKVNMEVTKSQKAVSGDRQNAGTKPVRLETGLKVQVPLFIEEGEKIVIDTETGEYISRAS